MATQFSDTGVIPGEASGDTCVRKDCGIYSLLGERFMRFGMRVLYLGLVALILSMGCEKKPISNAPAPSGPPQPMPRGGKQTNKPLAPKPPPPPT
jgi:hypothetical protein